MNSKYNTKLVFWNAQTSSVIAKQQADAQRDKQKGRLPEHIYRFDSVLEFQVYLHLNSMYPSHRIKRQVPVTLIPSGKCHPKGKKWRIDFAITYSSCDSSVMHYIEAKGRITPEFRNTLPILEITNPDVFNKLFLVFGRKIPTENRVVNNLLSTKLVSHVYSFQTFTKLKALR